MEEILYTYGTLKSNRAFSRPSLPDQKQLLPAVSSDVVGNYYTFVGVVSFLGAASVVHYCLRRFESAKLTRNICL